MNKYNFISLKYNVDTQNLHVLLNYVADGKKVKPPTIEDIKRRLIKPMRITSRAYTCLGVPNCKKEGQVHARN